jgi:hypothetical protein
MQSSVLLLAFIFQCNGISVFGSVLRDKKIKGDKQDNRNIMTVLPQRKDVPTNHAAKARFKMPRTAAFQVPTAALTPTASPTASRKARNPTPSPTASTKAPTKNPTKSPTASPTTKAPTRQPTPQPTPSSFQLRLYWESDYFWQETHQETWWCMECTKCNEYSLGDGPNHGCVVPGNTGSSCQEGHMIWIRRCKDDRRDYKFNILKNSGSGDQVRVEDTNLCLSTVNNRYLELKTCNKNSSRQLFKPITNIHKFELRPYHQRNWSISDAQCLSQLHHPKDKELVGLHQCQTARNHETLFWEEYFR